jgi:RNA polymerase sigma-70 factor (sigma-E family)
MRAADRRTGSSHEDVLLSGLYQQVTELQGARSEAGYDLAAGLKQYRIWLDKHTDEAASRDVIDFGTPTLHEALRPDAFLATATARAEWSADHAVIELYSMHYRSLVRLAALLLRDTPTAEEVVQDAFVAMHGGWQRLRDTEKALAYLRQTVVNRSRSVLRHRMVVEKNLQSAPPDMPSAEHGAFALLERSEVVAALRDLPDRQREAIVLRYYGDLSEAEIAATMGISCGAVKSHTSRGMAALRAALEQELWRKPDPAPRASARSGTTSPTSSGGR